MKECADPLYPFRSRVCWKSFIEQIESRTIGSFEYVLLIYIYVYIIDEQMTISLGRGLNLSSYFTLQLGCFPFYTVYVCVS